MNFLVVGLDIMRGWILSKRKREEGVYIMTS